MGTVPIDNLSAGMILRCDVRDRSGRLLLPAGAELGEKHLRIFRSWGVLEADVEGGSDSEGNVSASYEIDPSILAASESMVKPLFIHNDPDHPAIRELIRLCIARKAAANAS